MTNSPLNVLAQEIIIKHASMKFIFGRAVQYGFFDRNNQLHFSFNVAKVWKEFKPIDLQEPSF